MSSAIYSYSAYQTWFHKLDARSKLTFVVSYLLLTFLMPTPIVMGGIPWPTPFVMFVLMVFLVWLGARVSPRTYLPFLVYLTPIILGLTFAHTFLLNECPCFSETTPVLRAASIDGLLFGSAVAFRLGAMAICFLFFSYTTDPFDWGLSMYKAGIPYKGAFMFASAMRFYPMLQDEFVTIQDALKARGSDLLVKWYNPVRMMIGVLTTAIPLGLGGLRRSRNIALSMELRGFSFPEETGVKRQLFRDIQLRTTDWIVIVFWLAMVLVVVALRLVGVWSAGPLVLW
ncbi:MAG TPA: energy-coupling factor transporter transmembrane component T [Candidatus Sulfomarinibacteraceae bacterium]|nr:energy-coupling factor transporter transmembrane component T [Candidatus Sulfomarinibacteraceae bacterium]